MLSALTLSLATLAAAGDTPPVTLSPASGRPGDSFGYTVQAAGDRVIASSISAETGGLVTGSATIFRRSAGAWGEEATLLPTPLQTYQNFGWSIDLEGDRAVVGAPGEDAARVNQGAVYVFERQGGAWIQTGRIVSTNPETGAQFGWQVSLSGDRIAISAQGATQGIPGYHKGHIDLHVLVNGTWRSEQVIEPSGGNDSWAATVLELEGDRLVSTLITHTPQTSFVNFVNVYERTLGMWSQAAVIAPPLSGQGMEISFGDSLALLDDSLLIGVPRRMVDGAIRNGSVFAYRFAASSWSLSDIIESPATTPEQYFGNDIDMDGDRAVVATRLDPGQAFHCYREEDGVWGLERTFTKPSLVVGPTFGWSAAVTGDALFAGATHDSPNGSGSGSVLAYDIPRSYTPFCSPTPTSVGEPAHLFLTGPAVVDASGLELIVRPVPNEVSLIFFGDQTTSVPFGNGLRCVGGVLHRMALTPAEGNEIHFPFDPVAEGIAPGATRHFQAWFRDPTAMPSGFNLSDAITIQFLP